MPTCDICDEEIEGIAELKCHECGGSYCRNHYHGHECDVGAMESDDSGDSGDEPSKNLADATESVRDEQIRDSVVDVSADMKYCQYCGAELGQGFNFCPSCGAQQESAQGSSPEDTSQQQALQSKTSANTEVADTHSHRWTLRLLVGFYVSIWALNMALGFADMEMFSQWVEMGILPGPLLLTSLPLIYIDARQAQLAGELEVSYPVVIPVLCIIAWHLTLPAYILYRYTG